jgi:predicted transcriptional regulator
VPISKEIAHSETNRHYPQISVCSKSLKKAENNFKEKTNKKGQVRPTYKFRNSTTVRFCESFDCKIVQTKKLLKIKT